MTLREEMEKEMRDAQRILANIRTAEECGVIINQQQKIDLEDKVSFLCKRIENQKPKDKSILIEQFDDILQKNLNILSFSNRTDLEIIRIAFKNLVQENNQLNKLFSKAFDKKPEGNNE